MTQFLPPNLLALFAARDAIPYLPPPDKLPHEKKTRGYSGVGSFLSHFEVICFDSLDVPEVLIVFMTFRIRKIRQNRQKLKQRRSALNDVVARKPSK